MITYVDSDGNKFSQDEIDLMLENIADELKSLIYLGFYTEDDALMLEYDVRPLK